MLRINEQSLPSFYDNELNQYSSVAGVPYSYDLNGNLTDDGNQLYEYDYENRLIKARRKSDNALIAEYKYDPMGRRTRKIVHIPVSQTINYVYEDNRVIEERDGADALSVRYVYGSGIDEVLTMERGGSVYYYHFDRLGSVVNLSDATGNVVESYIYDVFGQTNAYGSVSNPYFFTGRRYDSETGLFYYRARMYSPTLGRFLQTDPVGYADGPNIYSYVKNDPINLVDPSGEKVYICVRYWPYTHTYIKVDGKECNGYWGFAPDGAKDSKFPCVNVPGKVRPETEKDRGISVCIPVTSDDSYDPCVCGAIERDLVAPWPAYNLCMNNCYDWRNDILKECGILPSWYPTLPPELF